MTTETSARRSDADDAGTVRSEPRRVLVVDNYDSFVYTIVGYLEQLGAQCEVVRNDAVDLDAVDDVDGVLVSPGPGAPAQAGRSPEVIRRCERSGTPMMGVCLGHQALAEVHGATVTHAEELLHGKTSEVEHTGSGVLAGLPQRFTATRYHSLAVVEPTLPAELEVTGRTPGGVVMALAHREAPLFGVQFHPESVLTQGGHRILANWLEVCGDPGAVERSAGMAPLVHR